MEGSNRIPLDWIEGSPNPIAVDLSRLYAGNKRVPIVVRPIYGRIEANYSLGSNIFFAVKEEQLDARCASREETEVRATVIDRGSQRRASPDSGRRVHRFVSTAQGGICVARARRAICVLCFHLETSFMRSLPRGVQPLTWAAANRCDPELTHRGHVDSLFRQPF